MILEVKDLKKIYRGKIAVNGLSFGLKKGEVVGLLGPNGAGKTTAFYMIIGLLRPDSGKVFFRNQDITTLPLYKRAQMGMGYLAQEPSIFKHLTVEQNLIAILETLSLSKKRRKERLEELLEELNLQHLAKKRACALSGGERRRLEITRSLITHPTLLLLDEPFANIDPITIYDVKQMILHLKEKKITVLITDHNAREISSIVDQSYLIQEGKVTLGGTVSELLENEQARTSYFGKDFRL